MVPVPEMAQKLFTDSEDDNLSKFDELSRQINEKTVDQLIKLRDCVKSYDFSNSEKLSTQQDNFVGRINIIIDLRKQKAASKSSMP